jgi:hypothetical protein
LRRSAKSIHYDGGTPRSGAPLLVENREMEEVKQHSPAPPLYLHVFLASPGDVAEERAIAREVMDRLPKDPLLRDKVALDVVSWDGPGAAAMQASMTPQEAIKQGLKRPSECDVAVVILWSRMGTTLPADWEVKADGTPYRSGTEWEYLDALQAAEKTGRPNVLVYRRTAVPNIAINDPERDQKARQWDAVQAFFAEFRNPDGSFKGGYNEYATPSELRDKLEDHIRAVVKERLDFGRAEGPSALATAQAHSALAELNALGAQILKLHHFKSIADQLHELYMDQEVRFLRSQSPQSLSGQSLKRAARSGETALEDIRALDEPKFLSAGEKKRKADNLGRLDAAVAELVAVAGAGRTADGRDVQSVDDAIANFTYEITTLRDSFNKLAEASWKELRLGDLGDTFARVRDQLSPSYPGYMARVDEGYRALTRQPPLFAKCDLLANEHQLLEKTLKELSSLQKQLEASFSPATLRSSCPRIKGFVDGARGYWDQFLAAAGPTDDWAVALLNSGKVDWNAIQQCRDDIDAMLSSAEQPQRDAFLIKLREAQDSIEPHFQAVDEALAGAFREVKTRLGEALTAVPAGADA